MNVDAILNARRTSAWSTNWHAITRLAAAIQSSLADVEELRAHGINVVGAINLQHVLEQQDAVERITGRRATNSVPASFIHSADELVIVDVPAEELAQHGGGARSEAAPAERTARARVAARRPGGGRAVTALHGYARHHAELGYAGAHSGLHHAAQQRTRHARERRPGHASASTARCW